MSNGKRFFCEGYKKWVFECPKNYISLKEKKEFPLDPNVCYAGVGWCKLTKKEIKGSAYYE